MPNFDKKLIDNPLLSDSIIYCFEITTNFGLSYFLTSFSEPISQNDEKIFFHYSGLSLYEGVFNDSARNYVLVKGIFEEKAINQQDNLLDSEVIIWIVIDKYFYHFLTYYCVQYINYGLDFIMRLEPETVKYNQNIMQVISKDCRTEFGSKFCMIDRSDYSFIYELKNINLNKIELISMDKEDGYFNFGDIIIQYEEKKWQSKITRHLGRIIETTQRLPYFFKKILQQNIIFSVNIIVGCDKKFTTCCNKFNNAINFRGEPFLPDKNFLKPS